MASPPPPHALSPPLPTIHPPPQKRRQSEMPTSAPANKRRKASVLSITSTNTNLSHPLRQTSFPAEATNYSRSPSFDNMSLISGSARGAKPKRPRKSRSKKTSAANTPGADDRSLVGFDGARSGISQPSSRGKRRASIDQSSEDEADAYAGNINVQMVLESEAEKEKEVRNRALLVRKLDDEQMKRYEAWRSSKLADATVRRIINQTLSQSVPANVILAIKSAAKLYAGEIIEEARKVQSQWVEAGTGGNLPSPPIEVGDTMPAEETKEVEKRRGPLEPEHLREALRRQRLAREGGLPGHQDIWKYQQHTGVERFGTANMGKKLMK